MSHESSGMEAPEECLPGAMFLCAGMPWQGFSVPERHKGCAALRIWRWRRKAHPVVVGARN